MTSISDDHATGWIKRGWSKWCSWAETFKLPLEIFVRNADSSRERAKRQARLTGADVTPEWSLPMWAIGGAGALLLLAKWSSTLGAYAKHAKALLRYMCEQLPEGHLEFNCSKNPELENCFPSSCVATGDHKVELTDRKVHVQKLLRHYPGLQKELARHVHTMHGRLFVETSRFVLVA